LEAEFCELRHLEKGELSIVSDDLAALVRASATQREVNWNRSCFFWDTSLFRAPKNTSAAQQRLRGAVNESDWNRTSAMNV
jgi:hypothetical protein